MLTIAMLVASGVRAGVTVVGNTAPGATSWSGTPIVASVANPSGETSVAEGFGSGITSYAQTFTVPAASSYVLDRIVLYAGGGAGTSASAPLTIALYDLGGQRAPAPAGYLAGRNLLGSGQGLPLAYTTQANGLLQLDFTGADRVTLVAGRLYVFEISGVAGSGPMNWLRGVTDSSLAGAAYRNRAWINGSNARDFALAVYGTPTATPPTASTIDAAVTHQVIDGFGAGTAFLDAGIQRLTDGQMDSLYGTGANQMGLTLIRVRISPNGSSDWGDPLANGQKAHARGARILATPWTPPAAMKDNGSTVHGSLLASKYQDCVDYLNAFTDAMAAGGAPVDVVSLQNEPDFDPTYEGCQWTAEQFRIFCRDFAGGLKVPVMMPESYSYAQTVSDATLNDPVAVANVDYIGGHLYGATIRDYPLAHARGKPTWMTEYLENDQTIESAVATAQQVQDCLTVGNMSAYIWWKTIGNANGLLDASGVLQRRAYVMGQFSRFVRPGDVRLDVPANDSSLALSAFRNPVTGKLAIIAVNATAAAIDHTFNLQGVTAASVTPWVTSAAESLQAHPAVTVTNAAFPYTIPANTVVTFVAAPAAAPVIVSAPESHTVETGGTVVLEVAASGEPLVYQWLHDGTAMPGATDRLLVITNARTSDAGSYAARATNSVGSVTSGAATVSVATTGDPAHLVNLSVRAYVGAGDNVPIPGFVIGGSGSRRMLIRASGPALGFAGTVADPTMELHSGEAVQTNDDWDKALAPVFAASGAFGWTEGSKDAALLATLHPGAHTAIVRGKAGGTGIALVEVYDADAGVGSASLRNLSGRALVRSGDEVMIAGLVLSGSSAGTVILRASGPALTQLTGLAGTLPDPVLELHRQSDNAILAVSDNWDATLAPRFAAAGAFSWQAGSKDAAVMRTLETGAYTVIVKDKSGASGIALIEVYLVP